MSSPVWAGDSGTRLHIAPLFPVFLLLLLLLLMVPLPALTPIGLGSGEEEGLGERDILEAVMSHSLPLRGWKGLFLLGLILWSFVSSETLIPL